MPPGKPWCFWYGSHDPHRPYREGQGSAGGIKPADVLVPPFLPDVPEVRSDIADYYFAVQRYDRDTGEMVRQIEERGELDHTLVVMTSDNGMPFPRAKANCYEYSNHMPLAVCWGEKVKGGRKVDALVSHVDFAPTFLEAAGIKPPPEMDGRSLLPLLRRGRRPPRGAGGRRGSGSAASPAAPLRATVFIERERHANVRAGDASYPMRGVRTGRFLYVRNLRPDLWPAGDPQFWKAVGPFGDIDGGPSKDLPAGPPGRRRRSRVVPARLREAAGRGVVRFGEGPLRDEERSGVHRIQRGAGGAARRRRASGWPTRETPVPPAAGRTMRSTSTRTPGRPIRRSPGRDGRRSRGGAG